MGDVETKKLTFNMNSTGFLFGVFSKTQAAVFKNSRQFSSKLKNFCQKLKEIVTFSVNLNYFHNLFAKENSQIIGLKCPQIDKLAVFH